jgi:alpha-1,3-rhamnosyl/mannosyltransferase
MDLNRRDPGSSRGVGSFDLTTVGKTDLDHGGAVADSPAVGRGPLRVAMIYDLNACKNPTGVTRHALGQLEGLAGRPEIELNLISGRITAPEGRAFWGTLGALPRRELPARTRDMLRWWRLAPWPSVEWWSGEVDWVYSPAEYGLPARRALRAVTSHDIHQNLNHGSPKYHRRFGDVFRRADLVLSVSRFNTMRLLEAFPECAGKVARVPNAADDEFFSPASVRERTEARDDLGLPRDMPYFLSVANFQPRKNLSRLIRASARLREVERGEVALVLLGAGNESEARALRAAASDAGPRVVVRMPGYRHGRALRAIYAEAAALVFPSLCESFGIPAVEAMAQGIPVALADNTALPEIGGDAGWYFPPEDEDAITAALRELLDADAERARRVAVGREIAGRYRWRAASDHLVDAFSGRREPVG